jgi:hypothetical protein
MSVFATFRRKRILLPIVSLLFLIAAAYMAVLRSESSRIIIYNQTGEPIAILKVAACSQSTLFLKVEEEGSFRWKLEPEGSPDEIELEAVSEFPWEWRGAYIQPTGGYRVTLRLWPDGEVEVHTQISLWQRMFRGAPSINE